MSTDATADRARTRALPTALRALRHRNFRLFIAGQLVSLIGTWMQSVAQAWLVYRLTGSSVLLGAVGFAGQIPVFLLAPIGGTVADAADRRKVVMATQAASMILAFVLAGLALAGTIHVWHVMALAALLGFVNAFDIPARQSLLVELVGREDLMNAIALNSSMFNGARIVGPAVAALVLARVGEGWCFLINGASYIAVLFGLSLMQRPAERPGLRKGAKSAVERIRAGFRFVARTAPIRALLLLLGLLSLVGLPYTTLMPIFADRVLGHGAGGMGVLMGASGVGALIGALLLAGRSGVRGLGRWVAVSSTSFGVCLIAFALSRNFYLSAAIMVPLGLSMMVQMASSNTLIQAMVPDDLRGRVMSVYSMMFMGMAPFGALLAGWIANRVGAPATVAGGGVLCILFGAIPFALRLPSLRPAARSLVLAQQAAAGVPAGGSIGAGVALPEPAPAAATVATD